MPKPIPLVLATHNKGKIREIHRLLSGYPIDLKTLDDFGPIPPVVEDGDSFEANAYKKASHVARVIGMAAMADDSGLMVAALDGAPGIHSARYGGEGASDGDRCQKLLAEMSDKDNRAAAFVCAMSIAVPTGPALTYEARCEGQLTREPRGENGFGYDPIFLFPELGRTFAQLSADEKGRVSHRGKALKEITEEIDKIITWLRIHMPTPDRFPCAGGTP
ncbi:MAG: XTP/dITP diphosphatase [Pseudomonadota bacterium]